MTSIVYRRVTPPEEVTSSEGERQISRIPEPAPECWDIVPGELEDQAVRLGTPLSDTPSIRLMLYAPVARRNSAIWKMISPDW